jgi:SH3 domain protein
MQRLLMALILFCIALPPVMAETRYVVDTLIITVRSGQGEQYRIIKTIPSGTAMEILESSEEWSQVRLKDGTEGWVLNQYISPNPTARQRLAQAEQQVEKLQRSNEQLQSEREQLR